MTHAESDQEQRPLTFREEALAALKDWQKEVAADRGVNPTEANASTVRRINVAIAEIEAI